MTEAVWCAGLRVRYDNGDWGLRGADISIPEGQLVAVVGTSGSGKTTLLNVLAGLVRPTDGDVRLVGHDLTSLSSADTAKLRRTLLGVVFQEGHLLPELTAADNVALPLRLIGVGRRTARSRAADLLGKLGLEELQGRFPWQLSSGQRQRVAVARAVVHRPKLVLADEPTGALDAENAETTAALLAAVVRAVGGTLVLVTHDESLVDGYDQVIRLADGAVVPAMVSR